MYIYIVEAMDLIKTPCSSEIYNDYGILNNTRCFRSFIFTKKEVGSGRKGRQTQSNWDHTASWSTNWLQSHVARHAPSAGLMADRRHTNACGVQVITRTLMITVRKRGLEKCGDLIWGKRRREGLGTRHSTSTRKRRIPLHLNFQAISLSACLTKNSSFHLLGFNPVNKLTVFVTPLELLLQEYVKDPRPRRSAQCRC